MNNDIYNLQVPIPSELADKLKLLAKEDDRNLRSFCKRLLQTYVDNCGFEFENNLDCKVNEEELVKVDVANKKKKVGALKPPSNN